MEFRDGKVARERLYYGEPWEPPAWRAQRSSGWRRLGSILPRPPTERLPMTQVVQGGRSSPMATGGGHCHCASATLVLAGRALYVPYIGSAEPVNDWQPR
jgi:hypothetical protein